MFVYRSWPDLIRHRDIVYYSTFSAEEKHSVLQWGKLTNQHCSTAAAPARLTSQHLMNCLPFCCKLSNDWHCCLALPTVSTHISARSDCICHFTSPYEVMDCGTVFHRTWKTLTYRTMNSGGRSLKTFLFGQWGHGTVWTLLTAPTRNIRTYLLTYTCPLHCRRWDMYHVLIQCAAPKVDMSHVVLHWLNQQCTSKAGVCSSRCVQCESKKSPLWFSDNFSKRLGICNPFLHTYYTFLSTLDDKFLCNYFQLWQSYAILSATTQRILTFH